jgi:hypothetical protein
MELTTEPRRDSTAVLEDAYLTAVVRGGGVHVDNREHFQSTQVVVRAWEKGVGEGGCGAVRAAHASVSVTRTTT